MISPAMTTDTTSGDIAGRAADAIADGLTSHGFDVRMPGQPGGMFLQVTNVRGSLCELTIFGCGVFAWEYRRLDRSQPDPSIAAAMIMRILGADPDANGRVPVPDSPRRTLKGQIGQALAGCGMQVRLNVLDKDESAYEVYTLITVTNPALPGRGTVCIDDDGLICWRGQIPGPEQPEDGLDLGELTRTLASALTVTTQAPRQGFTAVRPEDRDHN